MLSLLGYSVSVDVYLHFAYLLPGRSRLYYKYKAEIVHRVRFHLSGTGDIGIHPELEAESRCVSKETFLGHDSSLLCSSINEAYNTAKAKRVYNGRRG